MVAGEDDVPVVETGLISSSGCGLPEYPRILRMHSSHFIRFWLSYVLPIPLSVAVTMEFGMKDVVEIPIWDEGQGISFHG